MALFPQGLTNVDERCNAGERRVLQQLKRCLDDDYLVWHDVPVGPRARQPDFVILSPRQGILLLEVKDWRRSTIVAATRDRVELQTARGRVTEAHPLRQARDFALELVDVMQRDAALVHGEGPFRGKLLFPYGFGVVFSRLTEAEVAGTDFGEVFPPHQVLLRNDLDEGIDGGAFQKRLWGLFTVSYPHTLTLPQRDRIRWHLFPEIRVAQQGVLDVQSHGRTHTWLPYSESVIEFHHPDLKLRHLRPTWWNAFPERKPYWFQRISVDDLPWGAPVYENRLALAAPAVQPDPGLSAHLIAFTAEHGGREFFLRPDWRQQLQRQVDVYRSEAPPSAKPESQEEFRARLRWELEGSRLALEAITGKPVRFMCWPNGGTCEQAFELLNECGYWAATLPSRAKQPNNNIGTRPDRIGRISATSFFRGTTTPLPWVVSFALKVERNRGNHYMELPIKAIWLYRKFVKPGGVTPPGAEE